MNFFRYHWFDLAIFLVIVFAIALYVIQPSGMTLLLWLSLGSLFLHQIEEWRYPGYFPGMLNTALFSSDIPDRYPFPGGIIAPVIRQAFQAFSEKTNFK